MTAQHCLLCGTALQLTASWSMLFTRFTPVICKRCEQQFEPLHKSFHVQPDLHVHCLYQYNEKMTDYLHRYKFQHDTVLAEVFKEPLYNALKHTTVVPIPMHPQKMKDRTFAHVELLLEAASIRYESLLVKTTTDIQSTKTRAERLQTPQLFELIKQPQHKHYTIFDDIVTTGTTLQHARQLLLQAGAKEVQCLTLIKA